LLDRLWGDAFVEEGTLARTISSLRKALGTDKFIETVPKRGYRFISPVRHLSEDEILSSALLLNSEPNNFTEKPAVAARDRSEAHAPGALPARRIFSRPVLVTVLITVSALVMSFIISRDWPPKPAKEIKSIAV